MDKKSRLFKATDILLIILAVLPIVCGMVLKVLINPPASDIEITGAKIYFTIQTPPMDLPISESQVNSWIVIISIFWLCLWLTHGIRCGRGGKRQLICEYIVEKAEGLVRDNMDGYFSGFAPFIAAVMAISAFSSLLTLVGLYPPTADINIIAGWSVLVFVLITYYKMKCGFLHYLGSFADPIPLTPLNIISEVATPVSMTFRHFGNVLSGSVISVLIAYFLQNLSAKLFGWLPDVLGTVPFLQIGIPAILSGILTQLILWSVNLKIMGKANQSLSARSYDVLLSQMDITSAIIILVICSVLLVALLYLFFGTELGASIRATGVNAAVSRAQGIHTDVTKLIGLALSNGIVAFAGALLCQYQGYSDINMGRGAVVIGLAAVVIGEAIISRLPQNFAIRLSGVLLGAVVYYIVYQIIILIGLDTDLLKMFSAIVVAVFLGLPYIKGKIAEHRRYKKEDETHA